MYLSKRKIELIKASYTIKEIHFKNFNFENKAIPSPICNNDNFMGSLSTLNVIVLFGGKSYTTSSKYKY